MNTSDRAGDLARWQGGVDANMTQLREGQGEIVKTLEALRAESRERNHGLRNDLQQIVLTHAETKHSVASLAADQRELKELVEAKHADLDCEIEKLNAQVAPWTWGKRIAAALVGGIVLATTLANQVATFMRGFRP